MVKLRHVGHDEELVRALAPHLQWIMQAAVTLHSLAHSHHVVSVQQLRDPKLLLRQGEGQQTVPKTNYISLCISFQRFFILEQGYVRIFCFFKSLELENFVFCGCQI